jgi:tagatose-1,6-bisphosphate aldolase
MTPEGAFCMLALDHRAALRNAFKRAGVESVTDPEVLEVKTRIARSLGREASGILLDPAAVSCRPAHAGLLTPLEAQGLTVAAKPLRWALLGGSDVDGETFAGQLETACSAGGSGFIAGRAIWGGVFGLPPAEQERWLERTAQPLFARLVATARRQ